MASLFEAVVAARAAARAREAEQETSHQERLAKAWAAVNRRDWGAAEAALPALPVTADEEDADALEVAADVLPLDRRLGNA